MILKKNESKYPTMSAKLYRVLLHVCIHIGGTAVLLFASPSLSFKSELSSHYSTRLHLSTKLLSNRSPIITTTATPSVLPSNDDVDIVSSMPDPLPNFLRNEYYLLRHGQSTANVAAVISSDRSLAYSDRHCLTPLGFEQGAQAAEALLQAVEESNIVSSCAGDKILFVSSPFCRARQTAEACLTELLVNESLQKRLKALGVEIEMSSAGAYVPTSAAAAAENDVQKPCSSSAVNILLKEKLMERYFGRLDNEAIYTYAYVWPVDKFNVTHTAFAVESVAAVCKRIRALIVDDLEHLSTMSSSCENKYHVVLCSHADVLQIAQLYGANAENVGTFSSYRFANGEVRRMARTVDGLPRPVPLQAPKRGTRV
jgi:broad specificity phosphatase PhoE